MSQPSRLERVLEFFKALLLNKDETKLPLWMTATGLALVGETPQAVQLLYYLASLFGRSVVAPPQSPPVLQWFGIAYLGLGLILLVTNWIGTLSRKVKQLVIHYSQSSFPAGAAKALIGSIEKAWIVTLRLDQIEQDLDTPEGIRDALAWAEKRARKITRKGEVFYYSTAHIPIVCRLGFLLRTFSVNFLELDHLSKRPYMLISTGASSPLGFRVTPPGVQPGTEAAIAIEVSTLISDADIARATGSSTPILRLTLQPAPQFSAIKNEDDLRSLAGEFLGRLTEMVTRSGSIKKVHLFYSGPTSLIFRIGQLLNPNIHPQVWVYHYRRDRSGYVWGISVNSGDASVVQLP